LVIDDGIHTVDANIDALAFGLSKIKVGGCVVIEDIGQAAAPLWQVIGALLPEKYVATLLSARGGMLFVARRMQ